MRTSVPVVVSPSCPLHTPHWGEVTLYHNNNSVWIYSLEQLTHLETLHVEKQPKCVDYHGGSLFQWLGTAGAKSLSANTPT